MKNLSIFILLLFSIKPACCQILTFEFSGISGSEVTVNSNFNNSNLSSTIISRGVGLNPSNNADRFNATSWASTSIANAVSGDDYMEFTITPNAGFTFYVTSIIINFQRSGTGPSALALRSSVDNFTSNLDQEYSVVDNTSTQTFTFTFSQSNTSNAVTYRLYGYAEGTSGSGGIGDGSGDDIIVNGSVFSTVDNPNSFSALTNSSSQINLTAAANSNTDNILVAFNSTNTFGNPTGNYTVGNSITGGGTAHYVGAAASLSNHNGLAETTTYYYKAWSFDGVNYSTGISSNATTDCNTPIEVSGYSGTTGSEQIDLSWTLPTCYDEILIVAKSGSSISNSPSGDGSSYASNSVFGSGTDLGGNEFVVYKGISTSTAVTSLTNGTTYYFKAFTKKGTNWTTGVEISLTPFQEGWQISSLDFGNLISFDKTVSGVNNGAFTGSGLNASPSLGQLDSDAWLIEGMSDGNTTFSGSYSTGDFANGQSSGQSSSGGLYAFEVSSKNYALGVQPIGSDFNPGAIILKVVNTTGSAITALNIFYKIYVYNDQDRSNSFNFSYSLNNSSFINLTDLNFASTEVADVSPQWKTYGKVVTLNSLNIANNNAIYLKWFGEDISGSGSRDEFALDDITLVANPSTNNTSIKGNFENLTISGNTQLNGKTEINGDLNFINGNLNIGNNNLVLNGSISNPNSSNYILAEGSGRVKQYIANGISKTYPIGTTNYFLPLTILQNGVADTISVNTEEQVFEAGISGNIQTTDALDVTWKIIEKTPGDSRVNLTVEWPSSAELSGFDPTTCFFSHYRNGNWYPGNATDVSASDPRTITLENIASFSPFAIGSGSSPLPVDLLNFNARKKQQDLEFTWTTLSEINSDKFKIYHLSNDTNLMAEVSAIGNSNSPLEYKVSAYFKQEFESAYFIISEISKNGDEEFLAFTILDNEKPENFEYYFLENKLILKGEYLIQKNVKVFDIAGIEVSNFYSAKEEIQIPLNFRGIYFVSILNQFERKTIKVVY